VTFAIGWRDGHAAPSPSIEKASTAARPLAYAAHRAMAFTASASRTVPANRAEAFDKFVDFRNWRSFMPRAFRALSGPERALRAGDRVRILLDTGAVRLPALVRVLSVDPPREVVWGGGSRLLLRAAHHFVFETQADGGTLIRSDEHWTGLLARLAPIARRVKRQAENVGAAQLEGFARWLERGS
jgi:hypothetical protein